MLVAKRAENERKQIERYAARIAFDLISRVLDAHSLTVLS
jgi:hypothetical protein